MSDQRGAAQDVFCRCGAAFCFNCKEEAHRPVDCETVRKWMVGPVLSVPAVQPLNSGMWGPAVLQAWGGA